MPFWAKPEGNEPKNLLPYEGYRSDTTSNSLPFSNQRSARFTFYDSAYNYWLLKFGKVVAANCPGVRIPPPREHRVTPDCE